MSYSTAMARLPIYFVCFFFAILTLFTLFFFGERRSYFLTLRMKSAQAGLIQLYFDTSDGFREENSILKPIKLRKGFVDYRFALKEGLYNGLRLDPINKPGDVSICNVEINDASEAFHLAITPKMLKPVQQVDNLTIDGDCISFSVAPGNFDPIFQISRAPIKLASNRDSLFRFVKPRIALAAFLASILSLLFGLAVWFFESYADRIRGFIQKKPKSMIITAALLGLLLSSYPVVFLGKSFVSPAVQAVLLYFGYPSLPGYQDDFVEDPRSLDVGATAWAFLPYSRVQYQSIVKDHELPLWNRYNSAGITLLGQGQSQITDPLHWIAVLSNGSAWGWDLHFLLARLLIGVAAGLGVLIATESLFASLLVAFSAEFLGLYIFRLNHVAAFSITYCPWILLCWLLIARNLRLARPLPRIACAGLALFSTFQFNSGGLKESVLCLAFAHASGVVLLLAESAPVRQKLRAALSLLPWGVAGLMMLVPFIAVFFGALKKASTLSDGEMIIVAPAGYLVSFFDLVFTEQHSGTIGFPSINLFLGLGILLGISSLPRYYRVAAFWASLIPLVLALLISFGGVPVALLLKVPFLGRVYHLVDTLLTAAMPAAFLYAGFGFRTLGRFLLRDKGGWVAIIVAELLMFGLIFIQYYNYPPSANQKAAFLVSAVLAISALMIIPLLPLARLGGLWKGAAAVLLPLFIFALHTKNGIHVPSGRENLDRLINNLGDRPDFSIPSAAVNYVHAKGRPGFRTIGETATLFPGFNAFYLLEAINGPDALMNPLLLQLEEALQIRVWQGWLWLRLVTAKDLAPLSRALDFMNVRYVLADRHAPRSTDVVLATKKDLQVWERPTAWPRAFFVDQTSTYGNVEDLNKALLESDGRPFAALFEAGAPYAAPSTARIIVPPSEVTLTANTTKVSIDTPAPGFLILHESYVEDDTYVKVNGVDRPVLRANHAFRAVKLESPGHFEVVFGYWPKHFTLLLTSGLGGLFLTGLLFFFPRKNGPKSTKTS